MSAPSKTQIRIGLAALMVAIISFLMRECHRIEDVHNIKLISLQGNVEIQNGIDNDYEPPQLLIIGDKVDTYAEVNTVDEGRVWFYKFEEIEFCNEFVVEVFIKPKGKKREQYAIPITLTGLNKCGDFYCETILIDLESGISPDSNKPPIKDRIRRAIHLVNDLNQRYHALTIEGKKIDDITIIQMCEEQLPDILKSIEKINRQANPDEKEVSSIEESLNYIDSMLDGINK